MSLAMNIHTFLFFPLFLYKWAGTGLIIYILLLLLGGLPILIMEIIIAQFWLPGTGLFFYTAFLQPA
jgi:hypothetical protein